jgi:hypothetical protein
MNKINSNLRESAAILAASTTRAIVRNREATASQSLRANRGIFYGVARRKTHPDKITAFVKIHGNPRNAPNAPHNQPFNIKHTKTGAE